ncbi:rod shape-determining protein MreC [Thermobrachium celere]|uniref:Cell shape-determining protein MreC n=1 Tax=Thermobrachium celere DSM 8682 TaxID=941824 RepID=R7RSA1_9CLOT|nr:rod shape-determining protein MreC [Thermobrachium celere]CDF58125.1 Rod shape-determining protein MreC [Thermobrachium celere DSM 8682]
MDFLKNKLLTIILVLCLVLTIFIGVTANNKNNEGFFQGVITSTIAPIQKQIYIAGQRITNIFSFIKSISTLRKENAELKSQVQDLKNKLVDYQKIKTENEEMRKLLQFRPDNNFKLISANVIGKVGDNWFNVLIIDAGQNDGVKKGCYVRAADGLVGKVIEVSSNTSKVMTILDENIKIPVVINETLEEGLLVGNNNSNTCKVSYLPNDTKSTVSNLVITSNITNNADVVVPSGIIVGTIEKIEYEKINLSKTAYIKPAVNFYKVTKVQVIVK